MRRQPEDATCRGGADRRRHLTIAFHLTAPDPDFLHKLTVFVWATAPSVPMRRVTTAIPTTGPYMISKYEADARLTMVRNPYFRRWSFAARPDGYPDVIRWTKQPDATTRTTDVLEGRADVAPLIWGLEDGSDLAVRYPTRLHSAFELGSYSEWLNTREPPFNDWRVRRALNYAVDRRKLVTLWGGDTRATCQSPAQFSRLWALLPTRCNRTDGAYHDRSGQGLPADPQFGDSGHDCWVWAQPSRPRVVGRYYAELAHPRLPRAPLVVTGSMYSEELTLVTMQSGYLCGVDFPRQTSGNRSLLRLVDPSSTDNPNLSQYCNWVDGLGQRAVQSLPTRRRPAGRGHNSTGLSPTMRPWSSGRRPELLVRVGQW